MAVKTIRLELARSAEFPEGSARHGYEFQAPLDAGSHIDAAAWRQERQFCTVRRFWGGEADEFGRVVHLPGGRWAFHYDAGAEPEADEPGYRFDTHAFKTGEYVSITERDGETRTFRVISVR
jgi:hypothetical protein